MSYVVRKLNYRPWPVALVFQDCDPATGDIVEVEQKFIGHFSPFSEEDFDRIVAENKGESGEANAPTSAVLAANAKIFGQLLVGWSGVEDEKRKPLPFSAKRLSELVTGPDGLVVSAGINRALLEIRYGAAKVKNSNTSDASGQTPASASAAEGEVEATSTPPI